MWIINLQLSVITQGLFSLKTVDVKSKGINSWQLPWNIFNCTLVILMSDLIFTWKNSQYQEILSANELHNMCYKYFSFLTDNNQFSVLEQYSTRGMTGVVNKRSDRLTNDKKESQIYLHIEYATYKWKVIYMTTVSASELTLHYMSFFFICGSLFRKYNFLCNTNSLLKITYL